MPDMWRVLEGPELVFNCGPVFGTPRDLCGKKGEGKLTKSGTPHYPVGLKTPRGGEKVVLKSNILRNAQREVREEVRRFNLLNKGREGGSSRNIKERPKSKDGVCPLLKKKWRKA